MPHARSTDQPDICFHVGEMTTARTASAIAEALQQLDADVELRLDLPLRRIEIVTKRASPSECKAAILRAGCTPIRQWPCELRYFLTDPSFAYRLPTLKSLGDVQSA